MGFHDSKRKLYLQPQGVADFGIRSLFVYFMQIWCGKILTGGTLRTRSTSNARISSVKDHNVRMSSLDNVKWNTAVAKVIMVFLQMEQHIKPFSKPTFHPWLYLLSFRYTTSIIDTKKNPQIGRRQYGIKNKAAITLQCKLIAN